MRYLILFTLGAIVSTAGVGCAKPPGRIVSTEPTHVVILSGCNGTTKKVEKFREMIDNEVEGVSAEVWDWSKIRPANLLVNQWDYPRNMYRVDCFERELRDWRERNPNTKLYLVGFSGGAAIALWAVERLPEDFGVEKIVMIGGSVAPDYDLTPALNRTRLGVFNYYSLADKVFLRDGTIINGTMERKYCESAGYSGLIPPDDPRLAAKLQQFEWQPEMKELGNRGGHWGPFAEPFLRTYFIPLFEHDVPFDSAHARVDTNQATR